MGEHRTRPRRVSSLDQDPVSLVWARKQAGKTQRWLAQSLGISAGHMSEIESGTRNATPERLTEIANLLGCPRSVIEAKRRSAA